MINKIDDTKFEVDILELYNTNIKSYLKSLIINYLITEMNETKYHNFDILFLTPQNLSSEFYKTNFCISSIVIDGVTSKEKQDILKNSYTDITNESQIFFNDFEE